MATSELKFDESSFSVYGNFERIFKDEFIDSTGFVIVLGSRYGILKESPVALQSSLVSSIPIIFYKFKLEKYSGVIELLLN